MHSLTHAHTHSLSLPTENCYYQKDILVGHVVPEKQKGGYVDVAPAAPGFDPDAKDGYMELAPTSRK